MNEMLLLVLVMVGGGLGTFLLGMKHLSEGLQAVSGSGLRKFMSIATTHRLAGVGTGIVSTTIVQSSSIIPFFVPAILPLATSLFPNYAEAVVGEGHGQARADRRCRARAQASAHDGRAGVRLGRDGDDPEGDAPPAQGKPVVFAVVAGAAARRARPGGRLCRVRQDEVDDLPENRVYCLRCFWWFLFFHNPVGYRKSPPDATLNFHPFANAVSEWDANVIKI